MYGCVILCIAKYMAQNAVQVTQESTFYGTHYCFHCLNLYSLHDKIGVNQWQRQECLFVSSFHLSSCILIVNMSHNLAGNSDFRYRNAVARRF